MEEKKKKMPWHLWSCYNCVTLAADPRADIFFNRWFSRWGGGGGGEWGGGGEKMGGGGCNLFVISDAFDVE